MALLEVKGVTKRFGGLAALRDVSFKIKKGEIHGLIGPNGAGKSTMFKNITGFYTPTSGDIQFMGEDITGKRPSEVARRGLVRTFQETTLFQEFTVYQNVLVGCHLKARTNIFSALLSLDREKQKQAHETTLDVLDFMGLTHRMTQRASELPLGSQRALAIAVALVADPVLICMDEPFAGMNAEETKHMMGLTQKVRESGVTIVLVEHDMKAVMGLCEYITVLNFGTLLSAGTPEEVRHDPRVIEAYLGQGAC